MALTGELFADFSDFTRACDEAVVSLKGFETGSEKVKASLDRMVDNFTGRKIIQDATLMAEAVERVGGSSNLTEKELRKVGATATEAAEKLTAMGQAVPPEIAALAEDFKKLDTGAKTATTSFSTLVGSFVTADLILKGAEKAFDAIVKLVTEIGELALEGATVSGVAGNFAHLTDEAGRLGDTLLGALRTGTHNTITDFELMQVANRDLAAGMTLTDAQFNTLAKGAFALAQATGVDVKTALETMNDAMLSGRGRALEMLTGQIDLKAAEDDYAASLGTTAEKLDDDEKLHADRQAMLKAVGAATARLGEQTDGLGEHVAQAETSWTNFRLALGKTIAESETLEAGFSTLKKALVDAFGGNQQALIDAIALAVNKAAIVVVDFARFAIEGARDFNIAWSLVKTVVLGVESGLVNMSAAAAEAYARIAQGATYLPFATEQTRLAAASARTMADELWGTAKALDAEAQEAFKGVTGNSEFDKTLDKLGGVLVTTRDAMVAATGATTTHIKETKESTSSTEAATTATGLHGRALKEFQDTLKEIAKIEKDNRREREQGVLGLDKVEQESSQKRKEAEKKASDEITKLHQDEHDLILRSTLSSTDYQIAKVNEAAAAKIKAYAGAPAQLEEYSRLIMAQAAREAAAISKSATDALDVVAKKGMDTLALLNIVANQVQKGMAVDVVGNAAAVGGPKTGMQSPIYVAPPIFARAAGGPVTSGQPYMVGERGPELFVPSTSGGIVPNGRAGVVQHIAIHVNGTAADVARQVSDEIMRAAMRGQQFGAS